MSEWIYDRLQEQGTWRGLIMIASGITGLTMSPTTVEGIICLGMALAGSHNVVTKG